MKAESEVIDLTMDAGNGATPLVEISDEASAELTQPPRPRVSLPERPGSQPEMNGEREHSPDQLSGDDGKILVVGPEIVFNGRISSLDRLVIEGQVEAKIKDCRQIEIAETGHFKGQVEFERADIAGVFEGDLTVREHLVLRETGRIIGKVKFGELEIERGGQIIGDLQLFVEGAETNGKGAAAGRKKPRVTKAKRTPAK
jgi:cytoskeletal protein CcmA (bactofilin family)